MEVGLADLLLLCAAAFLAGAVDAVVGGGGLVQLPALLVVLPGMPVVALLGTNKLASIVGTAGAAVTYNRRISIDRTTAAQMAGAAFVGSALGALVAVRVGSDVLKPVVLLALVGVLLYTLRTPSLGEVEALRLRAGPQRATALARRGRDRLLRRLPRPRHRQLPGLPAGRRVGLSFLHASATAKIVNTATNLAALLLFAAGGHVLWVLGAAMAASNLAGSTIGARLAIRQGSAWVRRVFLVVVGALVLRLAYDVLGF
jgi:uncharacterized membrane protein YfcA